MKIRKIEAKSNTEKKKVAAYARVSTLFEEQEDSYETQLKYYTKLIKANPNWEFVKVYTDQGKSGASAEKRPGFNEMIDAGINGKFDILLVKSISRFARNAKEAQDYVHILKNHNVEVRFDRESISSFDPSAEMIFNMLAAMAQEEIRSTSERVKWTNNRLLEKGIRHVGNNHVLGYDEIDGKLVPNDDAWIVRQVFEEFAAGYSTSEIAKHLNESGAKTLHGKSGFAASHVVNMLKTVIYVGDRHLQQQAPTNYLTHKPDYSQPYTSKYIKNDHEGIIDRKLWEAVQNRRKSLEEQKEAGINRKSNSHFLYGKVFCSDCGSPMIRKTLMYKGERTKVWKCKEREKGKNGNGCLNDVIPESEIIKAIEEALGSSVSEETMTGVDIRIEVTGRTAKVVKAEKAA